MPFENSIGRRMRVKPYRPNCIVITRDQIIDAIRFAISVDDCDDGDVEVIGLGHCDRFLAYIDHEQGIRQSRHIFDSRETLIQFAALTGQG